MSVDKNSGIPENGGEKIILRPFAEAIHEYMMPYAEYIIIERSLPRVEDGLKPVQRRILYSMHELNLKPDGPYKKSARVVGDCLGKYHPHGDASIYQAMVNMAQDFNMRHPLVNGHGNFGSVDGDGAAAMRYTEVKLEKLACELLRDLDKNTVKWVKNFDDSLMEPDILPGRFPNLLVNGSMGIAIGLATNIPPHNLTEVINGVIAKIDNPRITLSEMLEIIKGPDFPTGGFVIPGDDFEEIYSTGKGRLIIRAHAEIECVNDRQCIVITELPYNVNKAKMQEKILRLRETELAAKKKGKSGLLTGIQEIVDESDRTGNRVVIRLKKGEDAVAILDYLYQKADLQTNYFVNMVAVADGRPQQLGLLKLLDYYIKHQREVILKRSQFDLNNAKKREHILDGYVLILPDIDRAVELIKTSNSRSEAKDKLRAAFGLSEKQADAVLDLRLANITKLEVTKIEKELYELKRRIAELEKIIGSKSEQLAVVKRELIAIRDEYKVKRLSVVVKSLDDVKQEPFRISSSEDRRGYAAIDCLGRFKFLNPRQYFIADRETPVSLKEVSSKILFVDSKEKILLFSSGGYCYRVDTGRIKESVWSESGETLSQMFPDAAPSEKVVSMIKFTENEAEKKLVFFTRRGFVKISKKSEYSVNKNFFLGLGLKEDDELIGVEEQKENHNFMFLSSDGQCLNSLVDEYPCQGRKSGGVIGMQLNPGAEVIWAGQTELDNLEAIGEILIVSDGYAKRIIAGNVESSRRARKGIKAMDTEGRKIFLGGWVTLPRTVVLQNADGGITVLNSEDILIDRNRSGKGKPLASSKGCVGAYLHAGDCEE